MGKICLGNRDNGGKVTITEMDPEYMAGYQPGHKTDSETPTGCTAVHDPVNNPSHYTDGGIETIDFIEAKGLGFNLGNSVKYISRAGKKSDASMTLKAKTLEDLKKALYYLKREIRNLEEVINEDCIKG